MEVRTGYPHSCYAKIANTPTGVPQAGDLVIWNGGQYGHIAVFSQGDADAFTSFDQNWPEGSLCHFQTHDYTGVAAVAAAIAKPIAPTAGIPGRPSNSSRDKPCAHPCSMKEGASRPSLLDIDVAAGLAVLATGALSQRQRQAIRERDAHTCPFPHPEGHIRSGACAAHHVRPQRRLKDQGVRCKVRDRAANILLVCENAHKLIHPMVVFDATRNQLPAAKQTYWNPRYDEAMAATAEQRTKRARWSGWHYPARVTRKR